jgi:hypothetical protein
MYEQEDQFSDDNFNDLFEGIDAEETWEYATEE